MFETENIIKLFVYKLPCYPYISRASTIDLIYRKVKVKIWQPRPYYKVSALQVQLEESLIHNPEQRPRVRQVEQLKLVLDGCESLQRSPHGCLRPSQHQVRSEDTAEI